MTLNLLRGSDQLFCRMSQILDFSVSLLLDTVKQVWHEYHIGLNTVHVLITPPRSHIKSDRLTIGNENWIAWLTHLPDCTIVLLESASHL